jgi:hypothetical protein
MAIARRIPISEPFQGAAIGPFIALSPERNWYLSELVPNFDRTPEARRPMPALVGAPLRAVAEAAAWIAESLNIETLGEDGETSAQNESSVVLYGDFGGNGVLFTGDAGRLALTRAIAYADALGISLRGLNCVQIPHHGSRRNVSPSVLDNITAQIALVSVAPKSTTHPRRKVTNAFRRRGARVFRTNGSFLNYTINWPRRPLHPAGPPVSGADRHLPDSAPHRGVVPGTVDHTRPRRLGGVELRPLPAALAGGAGSRKAVGTVAL